MGKEILFKHPVTHPNSKGRLFILGNVERTSLEGGIEEKNIVEAKFGSNGRERKIEFIERLSDKFSIEFWLKNWKTFHDAGLPIPPSIRVSQTGNIFVTNLRANGEEMYGKGFLIEAISKHIFGQSFELRDIDKVFFEVWSTQKKEIIKTIWRLMEIANENNIVLPPDDPFELLVSSDGSWKLVIVDLKMGGQMAQELFSKDRVRKKNKSNAEYVIYVLDSLFDIFMQN